MISEVIEALFIDDVYTSYLNNNLTAMKRDFLLIQAQVEALKSRIQRIMTITAAVISIEESRTAMHQNKNFARLTYLAAVFVPLSFVSSLFSMSENLSALKTTFWIFFIVAIPLSIITLGVADFLRFQKIYYRVKQRFLPSKKR
jgi:Mg2+ and Co2+ transporter CorA